jgi:putative FmdB family regulatory protein
MPIYEYVCSACAQRTEILHGIHDPAPGFCPECGAEGTLRKGIVASAVVFKGTGWAKKDRRATPSSSRTKDRDGDGKDGPPDTKSDGAAETKSDGAKPAESAASSSSEPGGSSSSTEKPAAKASEGA